MFSEGVPTEVPCQLHTDLEQIFNSVLKFCLVDPATEPWRSELLLLGREKQNSQVPGPGRKDRAGPWRPTAL
jgi:hypothetical protein